MARKKATIEFLGRLVDWAGGRPEFCQLTGITNSNLSSYLNGSKTVDWRRIRSATASVFGTPPAFVPVLEGWDLKEGAPRVADLPRDPGIYALFDSAMRVIYYGKATSLYAEVRQTLARKVPEVRPWTGARNLRFSDVSAYLSAYKIARGDSQFRHDVEALGLRLFVNNTFNRKGANFKRTD